jgi:ribonuclease P protein component
LRLVYTVNPRPEGKASPALAGFSVPKKKFRHSVDRHRIRRLMVEAWRLNKQSLYEAIPADVQLHVFCVFVDKAEPAYEMVRSAMVISLTKLGEALNPAVPDQSPS